MRVPDDFLCVDFVSMCMCDRCMVECNGLRSGKGTGFLSKLRSRRACRHAPSCSCDDCKQYRSENPYADRGLFLGDRPEKS